MKYRGIDAYTGKAVIGQYVDLFGLPTIVVNDSHALIREGKYVDLFGLPTIVVNDSHVLIREGSLEKLVDGKWRKVEK